MDVLLYLTELLQTNKKVGIFGLGTLYKKKSPGKYDTDKHAFIPPTYQLVFTENLLEDQELANYLSTKRNLSIDSANYYINDFVAALKKDLDANHEANLAPLGVLKLVDGQLSFIASNESNFSFDFFGLPELQDLKHAEEVANTAEIEEIETENKLEEENPGIETSAAVSPIMDDQPVEDEITEINEPVKVNPIIHYLPVEEEEETLTPEPNAQATTPVIEEETETKTGMSFFTKFLIVLLVIAVLGAITYFINPQLFNNYFNKNFQGKQDQNVPIQPNDTLKKSVDSPKTDTIAKSNIAALPKDTPTVDSSKITTFEVFVSAVKTDKMADKIIANLAKEHIKAKKVRLTKTKISISAGTFLDIKSAIKYRDSLRVKLKNEGIYEKEIKPINPKK